MPATLLLPLGAETIPALRTRAGPSPGGAPRGSAPCGSARSGDPQGGAAFLRRVRRRLRQGGDLRFGEPEPCARPSDARSSDAKPADGGWSDPRIAERGHDPYDAAELASGRMREALRAVAETARCAERPLRVAIRTRSSLVLRDLDLLRLSARRHLVEVEIPIATPDRRLARVLEPGAAAPSARIAVARRLRAAGVTVRVLLDPLLPGVTDLDADLRTLLRAVRDAGASIGFPPVRVPGGAARRRLLVELRRVYPRVAARYEVRGYVDARPPAEQADAALRRAVALARETGLTAGDEEPPIRAPPADAPSQRLLAFPA